MATPPVPNFRRNGKRSVTRATRGVCHMLRRVSYVLLLLVTACVTAHSEQPSAKPTVQKQSPFEQALTATMLAWTRCADESYAVQRRRYADRNAAAEAALSSCYTEEMAHRAVAHNVEPH